MKWAWKTSATPRTAGRQAVTRDGVPARADVAIGGDCATRDAATPRLYKTGGGADRHSGRMETTVTGQDAAPDSDIHSDIHSEIHSEEPSIEPEPIRFDTKIAVMLREDLAVWQRLNVTAFLVSGIGSAVPEVIGEPYQDASGTGYLRMFRQPVLVFEATKELLSGARTKAVSRDLATSLFTSDLFTTGNDRDNRAAVRAVAGDDLDIVGLAVFGPRNAVDRVTKGARMHP